MSILRRRENKWSEAWRNSQLRHPAVLEVSRVLLEHVAWDRAEVVSVVFRHNHRAMNAAPARPVPKPPQPLIGIIDGTLDDFASRNAQIHGPIVSRDGGSIAAAAAKTPWHHVLSARIAISGGVSLAVAVPCKKSVTFATRVGRTVKVWTRPLKL